ncbi:hypothetical protein Tco_1204828 [Tanacetum coccineum]
MSYASSAVTYTSVYTDSEPGRVFWGADEEISDGGSPRVIVYGYDGLPMQPVDPPSPDYVPGPEHPSSPDYVPGPEHPPSPIEIPYVPEPEYPEYLDPEEDSEEHADYPADGGDGDDEPSGDDSDDDTDDDDEEPFEDEEDDEEEEEHPAPADSSAIPVVDPVPSAWIIGILRHMSLHRHLDHLRIGSPCLPLLGTRIRMRVVAASPPLSLPSTSPRTDVPEVEMPPLKRVCLTTPAPGCEIRESSAAGAARQPRPTPEVDT